MSAPPVNTHSPYPMVGMDTAFASCERCILTALSTGRLSTATSTIPTRRSSSRVTHGPIIALHSIPPVPCSRLDGYAVSSQFTGSTFHVVASHRAGIKQALPSSLSTLPPSLDAAAWVTTGAPLPPWADTVVKVEDTREVMASDTTTTTTTTTSFTLAGDGTLPPLGAGVRGAGTDVSPGTTLLPPGHCITPGDVGSLLLARIPHIAVRAPPVVGILSSGDEVIPAPHSLVGGEEDGVGSGSSPSLSHSGMDGSVYDSNTPMLQALIQEHLGGGSGGVEVEDRGHVPDTFEATLLALATASLWCDLVVTTGGVSMGDADHIKPAVALLVGGGLTLEVDSVGGEKRVVGVSRRLTSGGSGPPPLIAGVRGHLGDVDVGVGSLEFGRLAMKPGKPTVLARLTLEGGSLHTPIILALPGNPVSAWVGGHLFALPLIKGLQGRLPWREACMPSMVQVKTTHRLSLDTERPEYHRAVVWWEWETEGGSSGGIGGGGGGFLAAQSTGLQDSSRLASTHNANALLCLPKGEGVLAAGTLVSAFLLSPPVNKSPRGAAAAVGEGQVGPTTLHGCGCSSSSSSSSNVEISTSTGRPPHVIATPSTPPSTPYSLGILTVSDTCAEGKGEDGSGPVVEDALRTALPLMAFSRVLRATVGDEVVGIQRWLTRWRDEGVSVVFTTGGTGFSPRDVTPEATAPLLAKRTPGLVAVMLAEGLKATPMAALSRYEAGIMAPGTLCINLPGSPKAVKECIRALAAVLPHALQLINQ